MTDTVTHPRPTFGAPSLQTELVHKVIEQSPQGVLAVWMRVSRECHQIARHHLYSHPHMDPARLVHCLKATRISTSPPRPQVPLPDDSPPPQSSSRPGPENEATGAPLPDLRDNLALIKHLHLISLPYPPDPHPHPSPEGGKPKSKADIIRRSIEVLADFELHARAGPANDSAYQGLFPGLKKMTLGITSRNVLMRDDLPGGVARLRLHPGCSPSGPDFVTAQPSVPAQCGPDVPLAASAALAPSRTETIAASGSTAAPSALSSSRQQEQARPDPKQQAAQDEHDSIQRIRMSILGQKDAVIGALQRLVSIVAPPVAHATRDSIWAIGSEGLRRDAVEAGTGEA